MIARFINTSFYITSLILYLEMYINSTLEICLEITLVHKQLLKSNRFRIQNKVKTYRNQKLS